MISVKVVTHHKNQPDTVYINPETISSLEPAYDAVVNGGERIRTTFIYIIGRENDPLRVYGATDVIHDQIKQHEKR
jgi:hypothetical protein